MQGHLQGRANRQGRLPLVLPPGPRDREVRRPGILLAPRLRLRERLSQGDRALREPREHPRRRRERRVGRHPQGCRRRQEGTRLLAPHGTFRGEFRKPSTTAHSCVPPLSPRVFTPSPCPPRPPRRSRRRRLLSRLPPRPQSRLRSPSTSAARSAKPSPRHPPPFPRGRRSLRRFPRLPRDARGYRTDDASTPREKNPLCLLLSLGIINHIFFSPRSSRLSPSRPSRPVPRGDARARRRGAPCRTARS